jgi:hypothetical protein
MRLSDPSHARPLRWLIPLALALIAGGKMAHGQDAPDGLPPDEWSLERVTDDHWRVEYRNSDAQSSGRYPGFLNVGDMTVDLHLHVSSGPETLTVTPPPGWQAVPPSITVDDGSMGRVEIVRSGEWMGM